MKRWIDEFESTAGLPRLRALILAGTAVVGSMAIGSTPAAAQQQTTGKFVYVDGRGAVQDFDIHVVNEDGTGLVDLSNNDVWDAGPDFSSNGRQIFFSSDRDGDRSDPVFERNFEIFVMNTDGSEVRRLTTNPGWDGNPDVSRDGRSIAWGSCEPDGKCDIHVMSTDGSGGTNLTNTPDDYDGSAAWSPNGREILFSSDRDRDASLPPIERGRDLYVMNRDGTDVRRLTTTGFNSFGRWSPDGRRIVYNGGDSGNEIWAMNADGTGQRKLRDSGATPMWSPNGREIAYQYRKDGWVMNADGSNVRKLTLASGGSFGPADWVAARSP